MKWIYRHVKGEDGFSKYNNPVCIDAGKIEKIVLNDTCYGYPTDMSIYADGIRFSSAIKPVVGRCYGIVNFEPKEYLNPRREITFVADMLGQYPEDGDEVDMRGIRRWEQFQPVCADPRIMYVFNVLCDAGFAVGNGISEKQCDAIRRTVVTNIPDMDAATAYHNRFGYPLGKRTVDSSECDKWYSVLNEPSQEKIDFLLSLIKQAVGGSDNVERLEKQRFWKIFYKDKNRKTDRRQEFQHECIESI